jgi:tRNA(adenine34) deaminase
MTDEDFMQKAIELGRTNPQHPFGAIIVDRSTEAVLAEGVNQSGSNPLFHGEIVAINNSVEQIADVNWSTLTLFTTAEPCPMCMSAILWCGIESVMFGTSIPTLIDLGWDQIRMRATDVVQQSHRPQTSVIGGLLESRCDDLFRLARQDSIPS